MNVLRTLVFHHRNSTQQIARVEGIYYANMSVYFRRGWYTLHCEYSWIWMSFILEFIIIYSRVLSFRSSFKLLINMDCSLMCTIISLPSLITNAKLDESSSTWVAPKAFAIFDDFLPTFIWTTEWSSWWRATTPTDPASMNLNLLCNLQSQRAVD